VVPEQPSYRSRGVDVNRFKLPQKEKSEYLIQVASGEHHPGNGGVAERVLTRCRFCRLGPGLQLRRTFDLSAKIGRSIQQKPVLIVAADCDLTLRAGASIQRPLAYSLAVATGTIPLRKSATRCGAQYLDAHRFSYSVATAYELISHATETSSKSGVTHSICIAPLMPKGFVLFRRGCHAAIYHSAPSNIACT
jgi:hypothetical protein